MVSNCSQNNLGAYKEQKCGMVAKWLECSASNAGACRQPIDGMDVQILLRRSGCMVACSRVKGQPHQRYHVTLWDNQNTLSCSGAVHLKYSVVSDWEVGRLAVVASLLLLNWCLTDKSVSKCLAWTL